MKYKYLNKLLKNNQGLYITIQYDGSDKPYRACLVVRTYLWGDHEYYGKSLKSVMKKLNAGCKDIEGPGYPATWGEAKDLGYVS